MAKNNNHDMKRLLAGAMAFTIVAGQVILPANVGSGGMFAESAVTAKAYDDSDTERKTLSVTIPDGAVITDEDNKVIGSEDGVYALEGGKTYYIYSNEKLYPSSDDCFDDVSHSSSKKGYSIDGESYTYKCEVITYDEIENDECSFAHVHSAKVSSPADRSDQLVVNCTTENGAEDELTRSTLENRFKSRLFRCVLNKDFSAVSAVHSGEWLNRLTSDTIIISDGLASIVPGICGMAVKLIGALVMIIALESRFCYLIVPGGLLLIGFSYIFRKRIKSLHKQVREKDGDLRVQMQDILSSMLIVRSYAIEETSAEQAEQKMTEHKNVRMKKNSFSNICNIGFGLIMNGAYVVGAAFCGYGILTKSMSYGTFMAVLQLIGQVQSPFANISGFLPQWYAMLASAERLLEAEVLSDQSSRDAMPMSELKQRYDNDFKGIELENACFTYQPPVRSLSDEAEIPMPIVLKGITLKIKKGEYVAFTGQSGCGKSTVMKLLLSLYKLDSGGKYVLTASGKEPLDIRWQRLFAYVPQGNHLMSGTIRDIISLPDINRKNDDGSIENALKIACADDFTADLEQGIETVLGERGQGLSEGQMQRIAVARAIFSDAPILLLDESTSALDMQTEKQLLQNLKEMTDKTVMIVTHRPAALDICDKILEFTPNGVKEIEKGTA